ncbi:MAG: ABC transporter ATP-binding protein [Actinomycetia bacterium]|nr:ABC transporter ATP-binding protein [Actinomycetes bacterium]
MLSRSGLGLVTSRPAAIEVRNVAKRFRKHSEPTKTLKERLLAIRTSTVSEFYALDDVDFEVRVGETFGILGHNGSGKSTLLKCIAGTIRPTTGMVRVRGRLSALLELGAGFHPDLTGRENVYLNGSILGFSKARIEAIFDEIVDFAGLEDFIDTQVKHYSSGMYARLGFAVAVNLEPDVLLIDEVLAVGDEAFQRKCIERVRGFQADGRTICLVTHSPDMVRYLCDRALVLDHGHLLHVGDVDEAVAKYRHSLANPTEHQSSDLPARGTEGRADPNIAQDGALAGGAGSLVPDGTDDGPPVAIVDTWIEEPVDDGPRAHRPGERLVVGLRFATTDRRVVRARMVIHSHDGVEMVNVSTLDIAGVDLVVDRGEHDVRFVVDDLPFMDDRFLVTLVLRNPAETEEYDRQDQKLSFGIRSGRPVHGRVVLNLDLLSDSLPVVPTKPVVATKV